MVLNKMNRMEVDWNLLYCGRIYVDDNGLFTFICNECTAQFSSGSELEKHVRTHLIDIKNRKPFTNTLSQQIERSARSHKIQKSLEKEEKNTREHSTTEHKDDGETFDDGMSAHSMSSDEQNEPFKIDEEENVAPTKSTAENRLKNNLCFEGDEKPVEKRLKDGIMLECDICKMEFRGKYNMRLHLTKSHMSEENMPTCEICHKKFKYMEKHMISHKTEKPHKCDECGASYSSATLLRVHCRKHTGERPYVCFKCGLGFVSGSKLTNHMKKHSDVKPFKCECCGFAFRERYSLKNHFAHVHSGIRPHACDLCDSSFPSRKALRQHQNLHKEKKFICKFCGKTFAQGSGRRGHEKRVHGAI